MEYSDIINPQLPPKEGYVEVVDENGNHVYKPTAKQKRSENSLSQLRGSYSAMDHTITTLLGQPETNNDQAAIEMNRAIQLFASSITDETQMMEIPTVYPAYQIGHSYKTKDIFRYGTNSVGDPQLYQVLQDHISAEQWTPDSATSLYKKIGISEDGIPIWVQPLGATDAYSAGDIVMYNGEKYKSLIDANVWSPDAYPAGWEKVTDSETETPDPESPDQPGGQTVPEFVQPTGAHDAYNTGDHVMYEGKEYESLIDGNTWSPTAYPSGWKLIE